MDQEVNILDISPLTSSVNKVGHDQKLDYAPSEEAKALKILLVEPLFPAEAAWGSAKTEQGYLLPIGTISVYSWLKARGYTVDFLDTQFGDVTEESLVAKLEEEQYSIVALPVFTPTADYAFSSAKIVRRVLPNAKIVFGNIHASTLPEFTMEQCPEVDFIIRHEAEHTFDELLNALAEGDDDFSEILGLVYRGEDDAVKVNPNRLFLGELDDIPVGFNSDLDISRYVPHPTQYVKLPTFSIMTQRGCPFSCSYCEAAQILGKKSRFFSPERIIEELKILKYEHGAKGVYFQDSTFTINKKHTMKLMELMVKENLDLKWAAGTRMDRVDPELLEAMYTAGCRLLSTGIESGNEESLKVVQKGCTVEQQEAGVKMVRDAGMRILCNFILCLPGEDEAMVRNTIKFAKKLRPHMALFYLPVPYPGSALYKSCKEMGGLRRAASWSDFIAIDFDDPVYVNPNFDKESMKYWYKRAYIEMYTSPGMWYTNLSSIRSMEDVNRLYRGGKGLTSMISHGIFGFIRQQYREFHGQAAPMRDS